MMRKWGDDWCCGLTPLVGLMVAASTLLSDSWWPSQLAWRLSDVPVADDEDEEFKSEEVRKNVKCTIYLAYTSNMVSSGLRETIRFLVQHKLVSKHTQTCDECICGD